MHECRKIIDVSKASIYTKKTLDSKQRLSEPDLSGQLIIVDSVLVEPLTSRVKKFLGRDMAFAEVRKGAHSSYPGGNTAAYMLQRNYGKEDISYSFRKGSNIISTLEERTPLRELINKAQLSLDEKIVGVIIKPYQGQEYIRLIERISGNLFWRRQHNDDIITEDESIQNYFIFHDQQ